MAIILRGQMEQFWSRKRRESARNLLKTLERETGLEPATSGLGNWQSIVNAVFGVHRARFWRYRTLEFPISPEKWPLMEYKWSNRVLGDKRARECPVIKLSVYGATTKRRLAPAAPQ